MTSWEFLIQRQGDRGWRTIKTGNLQMTEGRYRIAATSQLLAPQMQTRITLQPFGATANEQKSRTESQTIDPTGLAIVIPFTYLQSGIWQFVCSGTTVTNTPWHRILKLRVLPLSPAPTPKLVEPTGVVESVPIPQPQILDPQHKVTTAPMLIDRSIAAADPAEASDDLPQPTEPLVSLSIAGEQEPWADGLDRLLSQLERDSLQARRVPSAMPSPSLNTIQITAIAELPSQLISLNRSTFSGVVPGHQLTVNGTCNLPLLKINLVQTVKIEKLSICLRHPQTGEIVISIEQSLPPNLDEFAFSCRLELPIALKVSLLLGEVNLYDRHHIQIASSGFTITVNLNPLHEFEPSLSQLFDRDLSAAHLAQLTPELDIEATTISMGNSTRTRQFATPSTPPPLDAPTYPTVPLAYRRESVFADRPDIVPVQAVSIGSADETTEDLEIDFAPSGRDRVADVREYPNLEIVVDD